MKTEPVLPAEIEFTADGIPFAPEYGDVYHPRVGALVQARHVFLGGNRLPQRWQGRSQFTILETGFGLGNNFLAAWDAWRGDPQRCARLSFISIESRPPAIDMLRRLHRESPLPELADALIAAWPPLTPDLHRLSFDDGRVELLLAFGDVQAWLPGLVAEVDAFFLDGYTPARNPRMWDARVCKALGRRAAPGATLATWSAAQSLRSHLTSAGFDVRLGAGTGGKRDITLATHAPRFTPTVDPRRATSQGRDDAANDRRALIVGAGLAGCAAAWALAERGWRSALLEQHDHIAGEASGNPGGLFHGTLHREDGVHARFHRAAALAVRPEIITAIRAHGVAGRADGLLRLETTLDLDAMRALLAVRGLPPDYVQAVDADAASRLASVRLDSPAWHYPGGGWVHPAGLARSFIERGGSLITLHTGVAVHSIRRHGGRWQLLNAAGMVIDQVATLVLANAGDALRLLGRTDWPVSAVRGQVSLLPTARSPSALNQVELPIAGAGYLLPASDGVLLFGATQQAGDADPSVRASDHEVNLQQLRRLTGLPLDIGVAALGGRTAWRSVAADRLPLVGAVPELTVLQGSRDASSRWEQPRFVPREPGLFVFTGLGSRGIVASALGAQVLASAVAGTPCPLDAGLRDAIDPARFVSRRLRRAAAR